MEHINATDCFGGVVKSARLRKKMTQSQLAMRLSISTRYLKGIENSGRKPSYDLLTRIIRELDIPADTVFHPEYEDRKRSALITLLQKTT